MGALNGANQHTKDLYIEQIQREPQMARAVGQLLHERELVLQRNRVERAATPLQVGAAAV